MVMCISTSSGLPGNPNRIADLYFSEYRVNNSRHSSFLPALNTSKQLGWTSHFLHENAVLFFAFFFSNMFNIAFFCYIDLYSPSPFLSLIIYVFHISFVYFIIFVAQNGWIFPCAIRFFSICIRCNSRAHTRAKTRRAEPLRYIRNIHGRYHVYILCSRRATDIDTFAPSKKKLFF